MDSAPGRIQDRRHRNSPFAGFNDVSSLKHNRQGSFLDFEKHPLASDVTNEPEASELVSRKWSTSRRSAYRGLYRFAEMTSLVTSEASFESSASPSGSFVHFWRDASTIRCPNSHLVFVVVVVSGWRFSDSWRFSGSWRFRLFGVVSSIDYLR